MNAVKKTPETPQPHVHEPVFEICCCGAIRADQGEWWEEGIGKNPAARALGVRRILLLTPQERQEKAQEGAAKRWKNTTKKQRREYMQRIASRPRPTNRRAEDRCPCGRYTREYAAKRHHLCGDAVPMPQGVSHGR